MRIGIVGAGFSGRGLARLATQHGQDVMLSNFRDPRSLATGMIRYRVGTTGEAMEFGEVVVVLVPLARQSAIPPEPARGKVVLDACSYDPRRDGSIAALESGRTTTGALLAAHLAQASVVKALNTLTEAELERDAGVAGTPGRRALPIAGDAAPARSLATSLLDLLGFDVVDAGPLAEAWRFERGQPAHGARLDRTTLERALAEALPQPAVELSVRAAR